MEKKIRVKFLKSGSAYGFAYNADDCAELSASDVKKLEKVKAIKEISDAEYNKYVKDTYGEEKKEE